MPSKMLQDLKCMLKSKGCKAKSWVQSAQVMRLSMYVCMYYCDIVKCMLQAAI